MAFLKYSILTLIWLFFAAPSYACENGTALISGGTDYPPLSWRVGDKLVGANVKLVKMLFSEVGIDAHPDEGGPWKRVLLRARRGKLDLLLGVRKTAEREQYLIYIEPPITPSVQSVFVAKERDFKFESWENLSGKIGGVTLGTSFGTRFDAYAKDRLQIEQTRTVRQNFDKLHIGRIDYILAPLMTTLLHSQKEGFLDNIGHKPTPLAIINEYLAIPKNSDCYQYADHFSKRIKEIQSDGSWDVLLEEYFMLWSEENHFLDQHINLQ